MTTATKALSIPKIGRMELRGGDEFSTAKPDDLLPTIIDNPSTL
jgi:hypothetical protein